MAAATALSLAKAGHNFFLLGPAGSGKSTTLINICRQERERGRNVAVTCTTGIGCDQLKITGQPTTLHKWAGICHLTTGVDPISPATAEQIQNTDLLIVDEVSMLSAFLVDLIDKRCRTARGDPRVFGNLQVILTGDLLQLSPVPTRSSGDEGRHCIQADVVRSFHVVRLTQIHRQNNKVLVDAIRETATGNISPCTRAFMDSLQRPLPLTNRDPLHLFSTNIEADVLNAERLDEMKVPFFTSLATDTGPKRSLDGCQAPKQLLLKPECPVVVLKNLTKAIHNGTLGTYKGVENDKILVNIDGTTHRISKEMFYNRSSTRCQFPVKPAFGLTIHKSQGMTLDSVVVHCDFISKTGQLSVALGRVRKPEDIELRNVRHARCPPPKNTVTEFLEEATVGTVIDDLTCCHNLVNGNPVNPVPLLEDVNVNSDSDFDQEELEEIEELMESVDQVHNIEADHGYGGRRQGNVLEGQRVNICHDHGYSNPGEADAGMTEFLKLDLSHLPEVKETLVSQHQREIERFYQTYKKLSERLASDINLKASQAQRTHQCNDYMAQMTKTVTTPEFQASKSQLFKVLPSKLTEDHHFVGHAFLRQIRKSTLIKVAENIPTVEPSTPQHESHPTTDDGRGKLRYLAARTVFKTKLKIRKTIKNLIGKTSPSVIHHLFSHLIALNTLTADEDSLGDVTSDPGSLLLTSSRQNLSRSLVNVTDKCFDFFRKVDELRLREERKSVYQKSTAPQELRIHIMQNPAIANAWEDVFPISSDVTTKLYDLLMLSFLAVAINQFRKTLLSKFNKKKKKAHRIEVLITRPTPQQREVTPTALPSLPTLPEPCQQPPPTPPHPLPPTPQCTESTPDYSQTCKVCHRDNTQRWWIQCDKCDRWMHPKCIRMLVKDFKVLRDSDTGYICKDCRKLMT